MPIKEKRSQRKYGDYSTLNVGKNGFRNEFQGSKYFF